jgi:phage baseplate assembly protein gpV
MAGGFLDWFADYELAKGQGATGQGYSISVGVVKDNLNLLSEGRVQVHISSLPAFDPWARLAAIGGGSGRGFLWVPEIDDEVLVAFNENDERDAYVIGGLWSATARPPVTIPTDFISKRVIKTGKKGGLGHEIELDDLKQSVTVTTSTGQMLLMDVKTIELNALKGALKLSLAAGPPPSISIQAKGGNISVEAPAGKISLKALSVEIEGKVSTSVKSSGTCVVQGTLVQIN